VNNAATFNNNVGGTVSGLLTNTAGTTTNAGQLNGGASVSGGTLTNNNLVVGTVGISGTGDVENNATITGAVNNAATFNNNAGGTVSGLLTNTAGTTTNAGQLNGGAVVSGGTLNTSGIINGGVNNSAIVNASGGQVNGTIVNSGTFNVTGPVTNDGSALQNSGLLAVSSTGSFTGIGALTNAKTVTVAAGGTLAAASIANTAAGSTLTNAGTVTSGSVINNAGTLTNLATGTVNGGVNNTNNLANAGIINGGVSNSATTGNSGIVNGGLINTAGTTTNSGTINNGVTVSGGTLNTSGTIKGGLTNTATVNAQGTISGAIANNAGTFTVTGNLTGDNKFRNAAGAALAVGGNSFTGVTTLTNGGLISLAGGTIGDVATDNSGTVVATGVSSMTGTFNNQAGGVVDLTQGAAPTTNQLKTGSFNGQSGSAVDVRFNFSTVTGQAGLLTANGTSGTTTVNYFNVTPGTQVVLGNAVTVIKDTTGTGTLNATGVTEAFGLVNVSVQSDGHGGAELVRSLNVGAAAAPGASVMAALSAIDSSFHQSTAPFVASPQSQDPDKWAGGVWSRATTGQTTTKLTAFESFGGTSAPLRVKTNFDAYEVGVDTGILNFGGSGWNGHFGIMGGAVMATASESLSGSGTSVKFDVPFAGVYGVMTHGPFFMDLEARHDWVDTKVTNVTANLNGTTLKGHGESVSGSAGYHFDLINNWFIEPAAGFGLTQTQFDTLATNVGQSAQGIAAGTVNFDSIFSMLVHGGARVGTSFVVADTLALQPFGTLSVWRELAGQSSATFTNAGVGAVSDPLTLSRIGTFYQGGLGLSAQLLNTGFVGFARGDVRWGDKLDGMSVVGGLRYTFAP